MGSDIRKKKQNTILPELHLVGSLYIIHVKAFTVTINLEPFLCQPYLEFKPKYRSSVYCSVKHVI